jgi:hypothetical protein
MHYFISPLLDFSYTLGKAKSEILAVFLEHLEFAFSLIGKSGRATHSTKQKQGKRKNRF